MTSEPRLAPAEGLGRDSLAESASGTVAAATWEAVRSLTCRSCLPPGQPLPPAASRGSAGRWRPLHPAPERPRPGPQLRVPLGLSIFPAPSGRDSHAWSCR